MRTENAAVITSLAAEQPAKSNSHIQARRAWTAGLYICGALGIGAGLVGLVISFESLLGAAGDRLSVAGTVLIAAMFPFLLLAAHCMDRIREANKAIRLEYCRQNGMADEDR